jgi:hypothetical protein
MNFEKEKEESINIHRRFNIYYNMCRDITSVSLCNIVPPIFDPLGPSSHNPLYALREKRFELRGNSHMHIRQSGFFFVSNTCVATWKLFYRTIVQSLE